MQRNGYALKPLKRWCWANWKGWYNELNEVLIQAGILPNLECQSIFSKPSTLQTRGRVKWASPGRPFKTTAPVAPVKPAEKEDLFPERLPSLNPKAERLLSDQHPRRLIVVCPPLFCRTLVVRGDLQNRRGQFPGCPATVVC